MGLHGNCKSVGELIKYTNHIMDVKICAIFLLINYVCGGRHFLIETGLNDEEHGTDYAEETPKNESSVTKPPVNKTVGSGPSPSPVHVVGSGPSPSPVHLVGSGPSPSPVHEVGSGPSPSPVDLVGSGPAPTPTKKDLLKYKADSEAALVKSLNADGKDCDKGKLPKRCYCNDGNSYTPQEIYKNDVENLWKVMHAFNECESGDIQNCQCANGKNTTLAMPKQGLGKILEAMKEITSAGVKEGEKGTDYNDNDYMAW